MSRKQRDVKRKECRQFRCSREGNRTACFTLLKFPLVVVASQPCVLDHLQHEPAANQLLSIQATSFHSTYLQGHACCPLKISCHVPPSGSPSDPSSCSGCNPGCTARRQNQIFISAYSCCLLAKKKKKNLQLLSFFFFFENNICLIIIK